MTIRTAVIGFGTSGRVFHAPLIAGDPDFSLAIVVTASPERVAAVRAEHPEAVVLPDVDALFARADDFDLLVIGSPNETHAPLAHRAIDAGKHVLVDKPIAVTAADADAVRRHAREAGVVLAVFQNRRWDGDFLTLRTLLERGVLGEVRQFDSAFEWFSPTVTERWKDTATVAQGGGIAYDLAPHLIDQAVELFGPVAELHAELDSRRPGAGADDDAFVSLRHASGVRSRLWMSSIAPAQRTRFRVVGSEAVVEFRGLDPQEPQLIAGLRPGDEGYGLHHDGRTALLTRGDGTVERVTLLAGDYPAFYRDLAHAVLHGDPVPVDPADSIAVLGLIERIAAHG